MRPKHNPAMDNLSKLLQPLIDDPNDDPNSSQHKSHQIKMPQLALLLAKYFASLSKYCLTQYHCASQSNDKKQVKTTQASQISMQSAIKKPLSPYIYFFQEKIPTYQQKYPKYSISDLTRLIAKQWKQLPSSQKQPYKAKAVQDQSRYQSQKNKIREKRGRKQQASEDSQGSERRAGKQLDLQQEGI